MEIGDFVFIKKLPSSRTKDLTINGKYVIEKIEDKRGWIGDAELLKFAIRNDAGELKWFIPSKVWFDFKSTKKQPDWKSVAEKLAEALNEARNFTIWCEDIIETDDDELIEMYNQMEVSFLNNSHSALNEYEKLKDDNTRI